mgnify:FL=1
MKKQCYTLLMNVYHITGSHRYAIWFRHTLKPEIDRIPYIQDIRFKKFTSDDLRKTAQTIDITHMCLKGNVPPGLHQIAPNLKQLRLQEIPHKNQLQR